MASDSEARMARPSMRDQNFARAKKKRKTAPSKRHNRQGSAPAISHPRHALQERVHFQMMRAVGGVAWSEAWARSSPRRSAAVRASLASA